VPGGAGDFFQRGAYRLGDQLQAGQVAHCGQDVGGVGALRGAFAHQSGFLEAGQREVEETVGAVVLGETGAEVGQHTVVETGIVQLHGYGVLEVDAAADRLRNQVGQGQRPPALPARRGLTGAFRCAATRPRIASPVLGCSRNAPAVAARAASASRQKATP
jgi:hypothetical protein